MEYLIIFILNSISCVIALAVLYHTSFNLFTSKLSSREAEPLLSHTSSSSNCSYNSTIGNNHYQLNFTQLLTIIQLASISLFVIYLVIKLAVGSDNVVFVGEWLSLSFSLLYYLILLRINRVHNNFYFNPNKSFIFLELLNFVQTLVNIIYLKFLGLNSILLALNSIKVLIFLIYYSKNKCFCKFGPYLILPEGFQFPQVHTEDPLSAGGISNPLAKLAKLYPFLWPRGSARLKFCMLFALSMMILGRYVNALVPAQYKVVLKALQPEGTDEPKTMPIATIALFIGLKFLQGSSGIIQIVQNFFWLPVGQFITKKSSVDMLNHLLDLNLKFHLNRKTGEILRVQERGVASIVSILNALLFDMIPTLLDIIIQSTIIAITLDIWLGLMVFFTMIVYIIVTVVMTDWRTKYRRMCNKQENNMESKAVDCLLNFETVKFYNNEEFEVNEYSKLISKFQNYEWMSNLSNAFLNLNQNLIIQVGYAIICFVAGYQTLHGKIDITEFIQILAYLAQMFSPLDRFGSYYRTIQKNFIDMESMLNLLKIESEIADPIIPITLNTPIQGLIEFRNVSFHYDPRKPILKNVSFKVFPRSTVALVGPSGSGKSTILKLLFRFYDVTEGSILIDGVDIRHINQGELRKLIGIVPQETVLFNDNILYNIAYGKVKSDYDNIIKCSQMAQIHDRIQSFPDGYKSCVGERGLKLSGGEKQRVAIARTFLKDPPIVLLDEATSALDTHTERQIQSALNQVAQDRTTLVIAHRLSTVVNADMILVVKDGEISERGTHESLIEAEGIYHSMWFNQLKDDSHSPVRPSRTDSSVKYAISRHPRRRHLEPVAESSDQLSSEEDYHHRFSSVQHSSESFKFSKSLPNFKYLEESD